ncbi:MAG: hypothetical protein HUK08_06720, partial [Bacteroidaceae bacterium]|nr:hypothetical protein [Bacteroidaceae bacterium]
GRMLQGDQEALDLLKKQHPPTKISLILVAAMPYRQYLEGEERGYGRMGIRTARKGVSTKKIKGFSISSPTVFSGKSLKGLKTAGLKYYRGKKGAGSMVDRTGLGGYIVISDMAQYLKSNQSVAMRLYKTKRSALNNIGKFLPHKGTLRINVGKVKYR